jgi:transposase
MKQRLFVRPLTRAEEASLRVGLRNGSAFILKRCQILLASAQGKNVQEIQKAFGYSAQGIRNVLNSFNQEGLSATLTHHTPRPKSGPTSQPVLGKAQEERLEQILHQEPRSYGKETSLWTLGLLAQVVYEQGISPTPLSAETVRRAVKRLGWSWKRAKSFIASPDPAYTRKKSGATA